MTLPTIPAATLGLVNDPGPAGYAIWQAENAALEAYGLASPDDWGRSYSVWIRGRWDMYFRLHDISLDPPAGLTRGELRSALIARHFAAFQAWLRGPYRLSCVVVVCDECETPFKQDFYGVERPREWRCAECLHWNEVRGDLPGDPS